jgi:hypothetical protein
MLGRARERYWSRVRPRTEASGSGRTPWIQWDTSDTTSPLTSNNPDRVVSADPDRLEIDSSVEPERALLSRAISESQHVVMRLHFQSRPQRAATTFW